MKVVKLVNVEPNRIKVNVSSMDYKVESPAGTYLIPRLHLAKLKEFEYKDLHYHIDGLRIPFYVVECCIFRLENLMSYPSYHKDSVNNSLSLANIIGDYIICKASAINSIAERDVHERSQKYLYDLSGGKINCVLDESIENSKLVLDPTDAYKTSSYIISLQKRYGKKICLGSSVQSLVCSRMAQLVANSLEGFENLEPDRDTDIMIARKIADELSLEIGNIDVFVEQFINYLLMYSERSDLYEILKNCYKE